MFKKISNSRFSGFLQQRHPQVQRQRGERIQNRGSAQGQILVLLVFEESGRILVDPSLLLLRPLRPHASEPQPQPGEDPAQEAEEEAAAEDEGERYYMHNIPFLLYGKLDFVKLFLQGRLFLPPPACWTASRGGQT